MTRAQAQLSAMHGSLVRRAKTVGRWLPGRAAFSLEDERRAAAEYASFIGLDQPIEERAAILEKRAIGAPVRERRRKSA